MQRFAWAHDRRLDGSILSTRNCQSFAMFVVSSAISQGRALKRRQIDAESLILIHMVSFFVALLLSGRSNEAIKDARHRCVTVAAWRLREDKERIFVQSGSVLNGRGKIRRSVLTQLIH